MRPSLLPPACVVLLSCLCLFGCAGGAPIGAGATAAPVSTPVSTPVTNPVTVSNSTPTPTSSISVMISDPAACRAPNGPLAHVYITIADVRASTNPDAPANDPSFVDLTPGLSKAPQQIDLLGTANSKCFLASLSVNAAVAAGNYQQVRVFLAPDSAASTVANNACGASYANCVVRPDNSLYDLQLPAAARSGIQIAPGQITNASLALNASDQPAVDVNFDVCSSILPTADGGYEFNPIIHVGLIPSTGSNITGTVVSSKTGQALQGGQVVVALEQKDPATGVDRVLMQTVAANDGSFVLCPVPQGTYDLVAVGVDGANVSYSAGIETGIQSGQTAGQVALVPASSQGTLAGLIATQNAGHPPAGIAVAVRADALQQIDSNGTTITVPLLPSQSPYNQAMLTAAAGTCPAGADCSSFSMQLPTTAPNVVACSDQTSAFTQQSSAPIYTAESFAEVAGSGGIADCQSGRLSVTATPQGGSLLLNPGQSTTAATMGYTQCE